MQPWNAGTPIVTDGGVIPALIIAAAATLVLLAAYELYLHKKERLILFFRPLKKRLS